MSRVQRALEAASAKLEPLKVRGTYLLVVKHREEEVHWMQLSTHHPSLHPEALVRELQPKVPQMKAYAPAGSTLDATLFHCSMWFQSYPYMKQKLDFQLKIEGSTAVLVAPVD